MGLETELKFLIKGHNWKKDLRGVTIQQRYISNHPERAIRVRIAGDRAFLTIKGKRSNDTNKEYEWEIGYDEAMDMLAQDSLFEGELIKKNRYKLVEKSFTWKNEHLVWELDEFLAENEPLQVAEIELKNFANDEEKAELQQLIMAHAPVWIGDYIDTSKDSNLFRYVNANLSKVPFSRWSPEDQAQMLRHL